MKMIEYLYASLLLISVVLIYFAFKQYSVSKELMADGIKTNATVIDLLRVSSDDGYTYKPVFEYIDRTNKRITFESEVSSNPAPYKVGDKVKIVYSKTSDHRRIISFWGLYRWTIILLSFASPLLIIGGGYLLYSRG
ncbi:DUF3592 domain-containing protein [Maribacter aurantiacus]|uniref:DUF3592 domain-containing protein n=3 Tax=Flavobacteriaceae TaxID=49546 RepID=A0A5R8MAL3_9FLAO|nr:DUF3592 domain-containing protein [Maribacter algicola]TLF46596.1 DUF3592 domain-containing protein [Maribacter aurantiacus]